MKIYTKISMLKGLINKKNLSMVEVLSYNFYQSSFQNFSSTLLEKGVIYIGSSLTFKVIELITLQILWINSKSKGGKIAFFTNSSNKEFSDKMDTYTLFSLMNILDIQKAKLSSTGTVVLGRCMGPVIFIVMNSSERERLTMYNSIYSFSLPRITLSGHNLKNSFVSIQEFKKFLDELNENFFNKNHISEKYLLDNRVFGSKEALKLGIVDKIIASK